MELIFIRHGETDWNNQYKIQGRMDNPLNDKGRGQATEAAVKVMNIRPTKLISSPLSRAVETMKIIKKHNNWNLDIVLNKYFLERNFGELEGKEGSALSGIDDYSKLKGYEENFEIEKRVNTGINDIIEHSEDSDVIIVTCHSHTIKAILTSNFPNNFDYTVSLPNCVVVKLKVTNKNLSLKEIL